MKIIEVDSSVDIIRLQSGIGLGHETFYQTVHRSLMDLEPSLNVHDVNLRQDLTGAAWIFLELFHAGYLAGGANEVTRASYTGLRQSIGRDGRPGLVLSYVNKTLQRSLADVPQLVVSDHAYFGMGMDRIVIEGDAVAESLLLDPTATCIVPFPESAEHLLEKGKDPEKVKTVGLIVPTQVVKNSRQSFWESPGRGGSEPLNIGFFFTGQTPNLHVAMLRELIRDSEELLKSRLTLTIYTGTNKQLAGSIQAYARRYARTTEISSHYEIRERPGVYILYGNTPKEAIGNSLDAARQVHALITMMGERYAWVPFVHTILLPPFNAKTERNHDYMANKGLIPSRAQVARDLRLSRQITPLFENGYDRPVEQLGMARDLFVNTGLTQGSSKAAQIIYDALKLNEGGDIAPTSSLTT